MRLFTAAIAAFALALSAGPATAQKPKAKATTGAPAARDWRTYVVQSADGAFIIGNPAARVTLVEYLSYSCGHCAQFSAESKAALKDDLIRRGQVRMEVRHAVRDPLDMAATLLARCAGPRKFSGASDAIFAAQADWFARGRKWWLADPETLGKLAELTRLKLAADASGLSQLMIARGMTRAAVNQCFATPADLTRVTAMTDAAWKQIEGTPALYVNGRYVPTTLWSVLEPELRAAGAR